MGGETPRFSSERKQAAPSQPGHAREKRLRRPRNTGPNHKDLPLNTQTPLQFLLLLLTRTVRHFSWQSFALRPHRPLRCASLTHRGGGLPSGRDDGRERGGHVVTAHTPDSLRRPLRNWRSGGGGGGGRPPGRVEKRAWRREEDWKEGAGEGGGGGGGGERSSVRCPSLARTAFPLLRPHESRIESKSESSR